QVLLLRQNLDGGGVDCGRDDDLGEQLADLFGGLGVEGAVDGDDAAEGAFGVARERALVCLDQRLAERHAAPLCMLCDGAGGLVGKLGRQLEGGVGVVEV